MTQQTPRTFTKRCAQGDVMFIRIDDDKLPDLDGWEKVKPEGKELIVTHSETGHHHVLLADDADMFENKDDELSAFLTVHRASTLEHKRPYDTHEPILFAPGTYKVIRQREYTPEGYRRVMD